MISFESQSKTELHKGIESIINAKSHRLYEKLKPMVPVRYPYPVIGSQSAVTITDYEVNGKTLFLTLSGEIFSTKETIFNEVLASSKELDKYVYPLMRNVGEDGKQLIHSLQEKERPFPNSSETQIDGLKLLTLIRDHDVEHIFIKQNETLIPISSISLGFDWDRNRLFFSTKDTYTCSNKILNQHLSVNKSFIAKAKRLISNAKQVKKLSI
jgi:hypothetical protein